MATLITGSNTADTLQGGAGDDVIYGFNPDGQQGEVSTIAADRVVSGLNQPLFAGAPPGDFDRLFVVEKGGVIRIVDLATGELQATPFLDVTSEIDSTRERGLLGLAFHPDFASNGVFYVNLINTARDTEIRRYQVSSGDPNVADAGSASLVIGMDQRGSGNHKAGWLGFGPDGYLYAALGDGGPGDDPENRGQDIDTLLGKMLRLDVDADDFPANAARNYAIPSDNPFVGADGADEIWALGLRNPWRDSFDRVLGDLFIADVGQRTWEEINLGARGANYGWKIYEGPAQFSEGTPSAGTLTFPIHAYNHSVGGSVTGGYVYRGESEGLHGQYVFGDFVEGKVFTLRFDGATWNATDRTSQLVVDAGSVDKISSFGEDGYGNLYVVDLDGEVFRLTPDVTSADRGDELSGGGGDDWLFGGSGNDTLAGDAGEDTLMGGAGKDSLDGGTRADILLGGTGGDSYIVASAADRVVERAGEGADRVHASSGFVLPANVEHLTLTGAGSTNGFGNALANRMAGSTGNNTLKGNDGNDTLNGKAGNDTLIGGTGADMLIGGGGNDVLVWDASDSGIQGGSGPADVLRLDGARRTLDLTDIDNALIADVEIVDIRGSGDNDLRLALSDVLAISSSTDTLRIDGNAGDDVNVFGGGWTQGADRVIGTNTYHAYTQAAATLLVDTDIATSIGA